MKSVGRRGDRRWLTAAFRAEPRVGEYGPSTFDARKLQPAGYAESSCAVARSGLRQKTRRLPCPNTIIAGAKTHHAPVTAAPPRTDPRRKIQRNFRGASSNIEASEDFHAKWLAF